MPVYHEWHLTEIMARIAEGHVAGVVDPDGPRFVYWTVTSPEDVTLSPD